MVTTSKNEWKQRFKTFLFTSTGLSLIVHPMFDLKAAIKVII
jgi:hypothetical protein